MGENEVKNTIYWHTKASKEIKELRDADIIITEMAKRRGEPVEWNWIGAIIRRVHEVGYLEGKAFEKERLKRLLGI